MAAGAEFSEVRGAIHDYDKWVEMLKEHDQAGSCRDCSAAVRDDNSERCDFGVAMRDAKHYARRFVQAATGAEV